MSHTQLLYHAVWSTKDRRPQIVTDQLPRIAEYMGGIIHNLKSELIEMGGTDDHVHLITTISPTITLEHFFNIVKSNSSKWIHQTFPEMKEMFWQERNSASSSASLRLCANS